MDKDVMERLIETQETLLDVTANIAAIRQILFDAKITDPQALGTLFQKLRQQIAESPAGKGLQLARIALALQKDIE